MFISLKQKRWFWLNNFSNLSLIEIYIYFSFVGWKWTSLSTGIQSFAHFPIILINSQTLKTYPTWIVSCADNFLTSDILELVNHYPLLKRLQSLLSMPQHHHLQIKKGKINIFSLYSNISAEQNYVFCSQAKHIT